MVLTVTPSPHLSSMRVMGDIVCQLPHEVLHSNPKVDTTGSFMIQIIVHSDAGDSNGEIPKKDPLFTLVLLYS